jgi:lysophospholipase L1-like esterase
VIQVRKQLRITAIIAVMLLSVQSVVYAQADSLTKAQKVSQPDTQDDWANLAYYSADNKAADNRYLKKGRVVFMGNSITELWAQVHPGFFRQHKNFIDQGISGQTTAQMLLRFRQDVLHLKPTVVIILAGTNDIAENGGPVTNQQILDNLLGMYELAKANHIKVVICSILPAYAYPWRPDLKPAQRIVHFNKLLRRYALAHQLSFVDFFSTMANKRAGLPDNLSADGVHPNLNGYLVMERVLKQCPGLFWQVQK